MFEQITIEPVIVAAIVSAAVAFIILYVKENRIEPRRWKKNLFATSLEKKLQVYGELITLLESCKRKAERQNLNKANPETPDVVPSHLLENPFDIDRLQVIFEKSHYLLSNALLEEWYKLVRADEFFAFFKTRQKEAEATRADLRKMQEITEDEYAILKQRYDSLTGPSKDSSESAGSPTISIDTTTLYPTSKYGLFMMIALLAISVGLIYNGILYVNGTYELTPTYRYDFQFNGIDHYNKTRGFYSEITMESKAFAAHSPIHVSANVIVFENHTLSNGTVVAQSVNPKNLPEVYVVFPRSHLENEPIVEFPDPKPGGGVVAVYGQNGKPYWYGEVDLKYEMQGSYILGITSKPVDIIEEQDKVRAASFINIASEEVTSRMQTDRLVVGLTWAIMGIALLTAIPVVNAFLVFGENYDKVHHNKTNTNSS